MTQDSSWWKSAVVYQVYPRSFADSNDDGVGDLAGITSRVDHLARLGVDVVWLSPVYRSPMDDNGYDISDYQAVDPLFGTLEDLDALIAALHERGIRLLMDLVVNHTSDEHPWFVEARSSRDSPKRDWFWWHPPRHGMQAGDPGAEPTNWMSAFSGSAWELDEASGEYYLHLFSKKQPDLNWENPQVRHAVYEMMRWWLDRGVDGFRMDVINMISKVTPLADAAGSHGGLWADAGSQFLNGPRVHEFLQEMRREVFAGRDGTFLTVGETPGCTIDDARLYTDPDRGEVDMVFQFEHVKVDQGPGGKWDVQPLRLTDLKATLGRWQAGLADVGWNSLYLSNHDQPRPVSRFGDDGEHRVRSATLLATVLHLHRGTPYVYQGEELGMTNYPFGGIEDFHDIESLNHFAAARAAGEDAEHTLAALRFMSRDNARTPMQWDDTEHAGFSTVPPWIAVNPNYPAVNAAAGWEDPQSVLNHYRRLIELRHTEPIVVHGDFTMLLPHHEQVYAFTRNLDGRRLLVVANMSGSPATVDGLPDADEWAASELLLGNIDAATGTSWTLQPWEARVYRRGTANSG